MFSTFCSVMTDGGSKLNCSRGFFPCCWFTELSHWDRLSLKEKALSWYPHFRGQTGSNFEKGGVFVLCLGDSGRRRDLKDQKTKGLRPTTDHVTTGPQDSGTMGRVDGR